MKIEIQLLSFLISIVYGIIYFLLYKKIYLFLYASRKYSILNTFLFNLISVIIYYKIMFSINNGDIKTQFISTSIITFLLLNKIFTKKM